MRRDASWSCTRAEARSGSPCSAAERRVRRRRGRKRPRRRSGRRMARRVRSRSRRAHRPTARRALRDPCRSIVVSGRRAAVSGRPSRRCSRTGRRIAVTSGRRGQTGILRRGPNLRATIRPTMRRRGSVSFASSTSDRASCRGAARPRSGDRLRSLSRAEVRRRRTRSRRARSDGRTRSRAPCRCAATGRTRPRARPSPSGRSGYRRGRRCRTAALVTVERRASSA